MVHIGLDEIRHRERLLGRQLDREEIRSIKQSYGLTDGQMQRIEEQYGSS